MYKQQNQELRKNLQFLDGNQYDMNLECNDLRNTIQEMQKEIEFYKKRKIMNMKNFMNDTN